MLDTGDTRLIIETGKRFGLLRNQLGYCLGTTALETNYTMKPVEEAYYLNNAEAWRKRNLRYWPWHGRGYVQLTFEFNYQRATDELNVDFITDPTLAMVPKHAAMILIKGCRDGWFTGKKLGDYITLKRSDFVGARAVVNGSDRAELIAALATDYDQALLAEGYGVDPEPGDTTADDLLIAYLAHPDVAPGSIQARIVKALRGDAE